MSFDTLAPVYRAMEAVLAGRLLHRARTAFLAEAAPCRNALLLGEGPGRFLEDLLRAQPRLQVTCIERSAPMIRLARARLDRLGLPGTRVRFERADALQWSPPPGTFDLVASHFFLDCFQPDEIRRIAGRVNGATTADARWLVADFQVPDSGWRRLRALAIHRLMYAFFGIATGLSARRLTAPDPCLADAGFRLEARQVYNHGLIHSDLWRRTGPVG